ncbi:hypothetical protein LJC60_00545 [Ruminococcaceae bacterium OttesenSCG-928-D13]|nr:hypothetical protein [Ruminococcaceae bacterium OttesenSCG-928-D13]
MGEQEYIKRLEAEVSAMRATITGRANRDRDLRPRDQHCGYRVISKKEGEWVAIRGGAVQGRKPAYIVELETPYTSTMRIYPLRESIKQAVCELAANSDFEGPEPPKLFDLKMFVQRGPADFWAVTCFFNKEWTEISQEGGEK